MSSYIAKQVNALFLLVISLVLLGAYYFQFGLGDFPCPLCLLQRFAMLALGLGLFLNIRFGPRPSHYGVVIISALFGISISIRQILMHIVPGTGAYGSAFLGLHDYTWAFLVFFSSLLAVGLLLFFNRQFVETSEAQMKKSMPWFGKLVAWLFVLLITANIVTTFLECGIKQCPDNPMRYILLQ